MDLGSFVSSADYEGIEGFGSSSAQEVNNLFKALRAGQQINPPGSAVPGDGFTIKPESLDRTLKNVTYRAEHTVFWKQCDRTPAYNTVEEYSRLREYGNGVAAFIGEGELPVEDDATYSREFNVVKYMGTTRRVTHVMQTVRSHIGNVIAQETTNGTLWLLRQVEKALFYGNSSLVPEEFDGLFTQLKQQNAGTANIIDMRGKPFSQEVVEEAAHIIRAVPNFGNGTDLYMADGAYSDFAQLFYPTQRSQIPTPSAPDGMVGFQVAGMRTQSGPIRFQPDVFIEPGRAPIANGVGDVSKRPSPPTLSASAAGAPGGSRVSQFLAADAGDYRYKVAARNRFGISAPVDLDAGAGVTVAAGQEVTFSITDNGLASSFIIYRTELNGAAGTEVQMTEVSVAAGAAYFDDNDDLPGTTSGALIQGNRENMVIKQLAPFTRIPLATIDTSTRWAQVLYLVLTIHSPRKNVLFTNVGRRAGTKAPAI